MRFDVDYPDMPLISSLGFITLDYLDFLMMMDPVSYMCHRKLVRVRPGPRCDVLALKRCYNVERVARVQNDTAKLMQHGDTHLRTFESLDSRRSKVRDHIWHDLRVLVPKLP